MANKLYDEASIQAIANSIRSKTGSTDTMKVSEMSAAIDGISAGSGDVPLKWGGVNGTRVATHSATFTLSDTSFVVGTTAPTSASSIKASSTSDSRKCYAGGLDVGDKDIIVVQRVLAQPVITDGTSTGRQIATASVTMHYVSKRQSGYTSLTARTARGVSAAFNNNLLAYVSTSGTTSVYPTSSSTSYGLYGIPTAPTVSSQTAQGCSITVGTPTLYIRCSSSYMSATNAKCITDATWDWYLEVYLADPRSTPADAAFYELGYMLKNLEIDRT